MKTNDAKVADSQAMERLRRIISQQVKDDTVYIKWNHSHRITRVCGSKGPTRGSYTYEILTIDKYFVPLVYSWYRHNIQHYTRNSSVKFEGSAPRYSQFDGSSLKEWVEPQSISPEGFNYKSDKYLHSIQKSMASFSFMDSWMSHQQTRSKMAYKTLMFLSRSHIDPSNPNSASAGFPERVKSKIISNWKLKKDALKTIRIKTQNGSKNEITLIRDAVGLWTVDTATKSKYLNNVECISPFDVEHIVSNSYGADNSGKQAFVNSR